MQGFVDAHNDFIFASLTGNAEVPCSILQQFRFIKADKSLFSAALQIHNPDKLILLCKVHRSAVFQAEIKNSLLASDTSGRD